MGSKASSDVVSLAQIPLTLLAAAGLSGNLWPEQAVLENNTTYDYIVVGAGSAGCVVGRRLAESKNHTVLMLEAGGNPPLSAMIASLFSTLPHTNVDYNYTSTRDDYAARSQNNYTMLTAGKMLGGTDSMNHFIHSRGTPSDYNCWAKYTKDKSWKYENILQYFIKSERLVDNEILNQYGDFHGTDGPMGISRQPDERVIDLLKAFAEVGNPTILDMNANVTIGYTQPQYMLADKKRQTPAYSYLYPIKDYSNLQVSINTRVTRIIFDGHTAVGVEAGREGKTYTFRARKEVIVSAGVFNTPQLLMLSGIGPKEHLESFNITVLKDAPVGDNLIDQISVTVVHKLKKYLIQIPELVMSDSTNVFKIPFPIVSGLVALNKTQTCPDYQTFNLLFPHDTPFLTVTCATVFGLRTEICDRWKKQLERRDTLYTVLALLQPKSRGTVRLGSTDPFASPVITTGYYTNKDDLEKMVEIVKDYITVGESQYFKEVDAEVAGLDLPECADKEKGTDEYWECYVLQHSSSPYHYTSTCPMGTVLDGKLRVKGLNNLRVVDASAMPDVPRAAPNAAVIMLAEKASDIIKEDSMHK